MHTPGVLSYLSIGSCICEYMGLCYYFHQTRSSRSYVMQIVRLSPGNKYLNDTGHTYQAQIVPTVYKQNCDVICTSCEEAYRPSINDETEQSKCSLVGLLFMGLLFSAHVVHTCLAGLVYVRQQYRALLSSAYICLGLKGKGVFVSYFVPPRIEGMPPVERLRN